MEFPIEKHLGETFYIKISKDWQNKWQLVTLVDGEKEFDQPGMSCGIVHFANPTDPKECLGHAGADYMYNTLKDNGDIK